jgi:glutathione S-transferase
MTDPTPDYTPPQVWTWNKNSGGQFANINRPVAGPTHDQPLPVGRHPLQLYSLGTPNGIKVTVMLEELLALGHTGAEYDAWLIRINAGEQFGSGFVQANPNSKIPALVDRSGLPGGPPVRVFESGAILVYLAEKFGGAFLPAGGAERAECLSWLFWQMGRAPVHGRRAVHDCRHGDLALVWRTGQGPALWRGRVPVGARVPARDPLGRRDRPTPGRQARPQGEPHLGRTEQPAAGAP